MRHTLHEFIMREAAVCGRMKPKKPTPAGTRVLRNLAAGRHPFGHLRTQSDHGGAISTERVLIREGFVLPHPDGSLELTDIGRAALAAAEREWMGR